MLCIGHRGAMGHEPENTLRSFNKAIELGAPWVELDVYSVENQLVVIHDDRLERTTNGIGYVINSSVSYLRSLDAGKGEKIPFLGEVFELANKRIGINVELKGVGTAKPVVDFLHSRISEGWDYSQLLVSSFNHHELKQVHDLDPKLQLGALITALPCDYALFAERLNSYSVNPCIEFINKEFVNDAHRRGLKVYVFTVNHPEDIQMMRELGVDGVFSNYPERVLNTK